LDILHQVLEEKQHFPKEALQVVLSLFKKRQKVTFFLTDENALFLNDYIKQVENPAAFKLAVDLCNRASDHLQRPVCQVTMRHSSSPFFPSDSFYKVFCRLSRLSQIVIRP
jgi:hypothetical protein